MDKMTKLFEGLEQNDLARLIHPHMHIDEYQSKMGKDEDVIVLSFKITGKYPAVDLVDFIEKGYEWVIDADVSAGELVDGDYLVFVEAEREPGVAEDAVQLVKDILNLDGRKLKDWSMRIRSDLTDHEVTVENIRELVPLTALEYRERFGQDKLDEMRTAAGVPVTTKAAKNDRTQLLRAQAGIL